MRDLEVSLFRHVLSELISAYTPHGTPKPTPLQAFVMATAHNEIRPARLALKTLGTWGRPTVGATVFRRQDGARFREMTRDWRYSNLGDLPCDVIADMPIRAIQQFCALHGRVSSEPGYTWHDAANDFEVCPGTPSAPASASDANDPFPRRLNLQI